MALTVRSGVSVGGALSHRIVTQAPPVSSTALFTKPAAPRPTRQVRIISTNFFCQHWVKKISYQNDLTKIGAFAPDTFFLVPISTLILTFRHRRTCYWF